MAKTSVAVEIQGKVGLDEIVSVLRDCGATNVTVDRRSGDCYAGVEGYFFIEFDDAYGFVGRRHAYGFHAHASDEHEHGWTRFELGADDRGRMFVEALAEAFGGWFKDERTQEAIDYRAPAAPEPALSP